MLATPFVAHANPAIFVGIGEWRSINVVAYSVPTHKGLPLHNKAAIGIEIEVGEKPHLVAWRRGKVQALVDRHAVVVEDGMHFGRAVGEGYGCEVRVEPHALHLAANHDLRLGDFGCVSPRGKVADHHRLAPRDIAEHIIGIANGGEVCAAQLAIGGVDEVEGVHSLMIRICVCEWVWVCEWGCGYRQGKQGGMSPCARRLG